MRAARLLVPAVTGASWLLDDTSATLRRRATRAEQDRQVKRVRDVTPSGMGIGLLPHVEHSSCSGIVIHD